MTQPTPLIFLLEDSEVCALRVVADVLRSLPECRLVHVRNLAEARVLASSAPVDVFLLDINLPDGNGLDFLAEVSATHPNASAIVMSSDVHLEHHKRGRALGVLSIVEKPLSSSDLVFFLRPALEASRLASSLQAGGSDESSFAASLKNLTPLDVIQMSCLRRTSGTLEFVSTKALGRVSVAGGEIVHAETGALTGIEALYEIVTWKGGRVSDLADPPPFEQTIFGDWQMLLMNAAHYIDTAD